MEQKEQTPQKMIDYVKEYILERLPEIEDNTSRRTYYSDVSQLVSDLCSYDLDNGTILMDEAKSLETICSWKYEAGQFLDMSLRARITSHNPFHRPGLFMVRLVSYGVNDLLTQAELPKMPFSLTRDYVKRISEAVNNVRDFTFNR